MPYILDAWEKTNDKKGGVTMWNLINQSLEAVHTHITSRANSLINKLGHHHNLNSCGLRNNVSRCYTYLMDRRLAVSKHMACLLVAYKDTNFCFAVKNGLPIQITRNLFIFKNVVDIWTLVNMFIL